VVQEIRETEICLGHSPKQFKELYYLMKNNYKTSICWYKTETKFQSISMEQIPWKVVRSSPSQEIPHFYGTKKITAMFKRTRHWSVS
jgi:hypothetical protein